MSNVLSFKAKNDRHQTTIEYANQDGGGVRVTAGSFFDGERDVGVAFWMTEEQAEGLLEWLYQRK